MLSIVYIEASVVGPWHDSREILWSRACFFRERETERLRSPTPTEGPI